MLKVFPQLRDTPVTHAWGGTVGITRTRMPHFGRLKVRILFGYGYSGHGVALATLGGKVLAEAALGKSERFEILASVPAKRFPGGEVLREPLVAAALLALKLKDML
jgi:gamma-glutamylputrescine oxidase